MAVMLEKLRRMREMSFPEIRFRAARKLRIAREQWQLLWDGKRGQDSSWGHFWDVSRIEYPGLRAALQVGDYALAARLLAEACASRAAPLFYWDRSLREQLVDAYRHEFSGSAQRVCAEADAMCRHHYHIFAFPEISLGSELSWRRDLVHGVESGLAHYDRLPYLDFNKVGDSKVVWEPNRHQHLLTLCQAHLLTGDERYAEECLSQWEHWMTANPHLRGINWASSLEVAFRCWSWLWLLWLLAGSQALTPFRFGRITAGLALHASFIADNLSTYFSPNTHLLGEGFALFCVGLLFPELTGSEAWRELGRTILLEQMSTQVCDDGSHVEHSTYYHAYATEFFLYAAILAERNDCSFPAKYRERLEKMLEYLVHTAWPSGSHPSLGDSDGGRLLPLDHVAPNDHRPILSTGAIYFRRGDFRKAAGQLHEQTLWLFGPKAVAKFAALEAAPSGQVSRVFADAGLVTMRSDWGSRSKLLAFDAGPQGMGTSAHGHADALSFLCAADGVEWLIDPGTYVYTASRAWRDFFRSTRAHNTAVVDDCDQAQPIDWFKWRKLPRVRLERATSHRFLDYTVASHEGYSRLAKPVFHRRRIVFVKPDYWLISDELSGEGEHQLKFFFHFAPGISLQPLEQGWLASKGEERLRLLVSAPGCRFHVVIGEESPIQGWYSKDYGHREPSAVLIGEITTCVPFYAHWLVVPGESGKQCFQHKPPTHGMLAIETNQGTDFLITGCDRLEPRTDEGSSDAELALVSKGKMGSFERMLLIDGSYLRYGGEDIFNANQRFARFSALRLNDRLGVVPSFETTS